MKIKFEKGFTPEAIGRLFAEFVRDEGLIIGSVNIYIQTYDENMKAEKSSKYDGYLLFQPSDRMTEEYRNGTAKLRRQRIRLAQSEGHKQEQIETA